MKCFIALNVFVLVNSFTFGIDIDNLDRYHPDVFKQKLEVPSSLHGVGNPFTREAKTDTSKSDFAEKSKDPDEIGEKVKEVLSSRISSVIHSDRSPVVIIGDRIFRRGDEIYFGRPDAKEYPVEDAKLVLYEVSDKWISISAYSTKGNGVGEEFVRTMVNIKLKPVLERK